MLPIHLECATNPLEMAVQRYPAYALAKNVKTMREIKGYIVRTWKFLGGKLRGAHGGPLNGLT